MATQTQTPHSSGAFVRSFLLVPRFEAHFRRSRSKFLVVANCLQGRRIPVQGWDTRRRGHYSGSTYTAIPADVVDYYNLIFIFVSFDACPSVTHRVKFSQITSAGTHWGLNRAPTVIQLCGSF